MAKSDGLVKEGASMKKLAFLVTVEHPAGCSIEAVKEYIKYAVQSWKGGLDPSNPLFDLDPEEVTVKRVEE